MAFIVTGGLGFIWVALWWAYYRPPKEHWLLGDQERSYILKGQVPEKSLAAGEKRPPMVRKILTAPKFWGIAIPRFLARTRFGKPLISGFLLLGHGASHGP